MHFNQFFLVFSTLTGAGELWGQCMYITSSLSERCLWGICGWWLYSMEEVTLASIDIIPLNFRLREGETVIDNYNRKSHSEQDRTCKEWFSWGWMDWRRNHVGGKNSMYRNCAGVLNPSTLRIHEKSFSFSGIRWTVLLIQNLSKGRDWGFVS